MSLKLHLRSYLHILRITIAGFIVIMVGLVALEWKLNKEISVLTAQTNNLYQHPFQVNAAAREARFAITKILAESLAATLYPEGFDHSAYLKDINQNEVLLDNSLSIVEAKFLGDMNKVREARELASVWHKDRDEFINLIINERNAEAADLFKTKATPVFEAMQARMDYVVAFSSIYADNLVKQAQERAVLLHSQLQLIALGFALFMLAVGGTTALLVLKSLYQRDESLRQANDSLRISATVFESQEGMIVTDANSIILQVNYAFTKITDYTADDAIGQTPRLLSSGKHDKTFFADMWASLNNIGTWEGEIWNRRKNGEIYPEYLAITAVKDTAGIVTNYVATFTDITLSKAASEEIKNLAFYDPLTQLPNRRLLLDRLNQALVASARSRQRGALLFLDLDHFKNLNDSLGHDAGDLLLQQVAERLIATVREGDTVSRLGGDEFVLILEGLSEQAIVAAAQTKDIAEKILHSLNQPYRLNIHTHFSTSSIGCTLFKGHEQDSEELLKQADIAMYQSKIEGRNTLRFFDPKMQEAISVRVDIEKELRKAIEQQQFDLYYQIQVNHHGQPLGGEALIRWAHPERGMISPFNFIPLAEETGLILSIGQWVLEMACAQLKAWEGNVLTRDLTLSVNVSAKQINQHDFVKQVQTTTQRFAINTSLLKLELTESIIIAHVDHIIITMVALEALGIRFELDDFGTGYSSLQYLKQLPLYQLKIDQSFVRDITSDSSDKTIVRTIIMMANSLGLQVIAEGVETEEQRQILLDNGCTRYQGYLFGKPLPVEAFEAALKQS